MPNHDHDKPVPLPADDPATPGVFGPDAAVLLSTANILQTAIFNSANFSCIATDAQGIIQIFNVGAEQLLGYSASEVVNQLSPVDIADATQVHERARALSLEFKTRVTPDFAALSYKASLGHEDVFELTYIRKDGSHFASVLSISPLHHDHGPIIGYLLIGTDLNARKRAEMNLLKSDALQHAIFNSANFSIIATDERGIIQIFNVGAEHLLGYDADDVVNKFSPADLSVPQELSDRARALSAEFKTPITPGFEALSFKAARELEDIYELTYIRKDGSRFPAVVSVTALRHDHDPIIGYLLISTDNTERLRARDELLKVGALQDAIVNSTNFAIIATDVKGVIQIFSAGAQNLLGYAPADVINKITPVELTLAPELQAYAKALSVELGVTIAPGYESLFYKAARGLEHIYELTYLKKDGTQLPAVVSVTALRDAQSSIIGYLMIGLDNTARKQDEAVQERLDQRLRDLQFYTRSLIESNIDALMTTTPSGFITDVNKQTELLTGCSRDELIGAPFKDFFTDPARAEAAIKLVLQEKKVSNYELTALDRDGRETVVSLNASTFYDRDRNLQGVFAAARDITERKQAEARILAALHDSLTHLPNRGLLTDRLSHAMAASKRSGFYGAILFIDLDNFKPLNDTYGHDVGDLLLIEVAARLNRCVREMDAVARFGGDEFVVMLSELDDNKAESAEQASVIAEKIRAALAEPYLLTVKHEGQADMGVEHRCSASVGVTLFLGHDYSQDDTLKCADAAMYQAKKEGGNRVHFHQTHEGC